MRIAALLLLAVAASEDFRANYDPMVEAARWLTDGGEPPAHWVVHAKLDLDFVLAAKTKLGTAGTKKVVEARYRNTSVVVKRTKEWLIKTKYGESAVFAELLFLEYCRGGPGIPRLLGGYREDGQAVLVVEHMGLPIGGSLGSYKGRPKGHRVTNLNWVAFAEAAPLDAARAIFRCFRSFAEIGGFILNDFTEQQFTYFEGALYLVDGPLFATGPAREFADGVLTNVKTGDVLHQLSLGFRFMSSAQNSYKKHVHDVATKPYLLPFVISSSEGDDRAKLEALSAAMTRPDPDARPSFTKLLAALG